MGDPPSKLADRFHLLGLEQLLTSLLERSRRFPLLGNVTSDLGKADDTAEIVLDSVEDDACPEAAAILALAPTFLLETAMLSGRFESLLRVTCCAILFGIER